MFSANVASALAWKCGWRLLAEKLISLRCTAWTAAKEFAPIGHGQAGRQLDDRSAAVLGVEGGQISAHTSGRMRNTRRSARTTETSWQCLSAAGDGQATRIEAVLPRTSALIRKASGERAAWRPTSMSSLSSTAPDAECQLAPRWNAISALVRNSDATSVMVRQQGRAHGIDVIEVTDRIASIAPEVQMHRGERALSRSPFLTWNSFSTAIGRSPLVGSSGVGKSTLTNLRARSAGDGGESAPPDSGSSHTTTHRQLLHGGGGGSDCRHARNAGRWKLRARHAPGRKIRERSRIWRVLTAQCKFSDCGHKSEPGCAVSGVPSMGGTRCRHAELPMPRSRASKRSAR